MVAGLCEAYGWTLEQAYKHTVPQLVMLNHATWVNSERSKLRYDYNRKVESGEIIESDPVMTANGMRLSELEKDSDLWAKTLSAW